MKKISIKEMAVCGIFAAILCIAGPLVVPIGAIPISLTNLVLYFCVLVVGTKLTEISFIVYLLLALVGLPVLSNYQGGPAKLIGPTGGYLIGFIPMVIVIGIFIKLGRNNYLLNAIGCIIGTVVAYAFGTVWFVFVNKTTFVAALSICVFPFIVFDIAKIAISIAVSSPVRKQLIKANLIEINSSSKASV